MSSCGTVTDTFNIYSEPYPFIELGNDTTICLGNTFTLNATTPNATYLWQDNSTGSTFNVTQQELYWVEVMENNCSAMDSIQIDFNPIPTIEFGNDTTLFEGETLMLDATTQNVTYIWQDNSTSPTFNVSEPGTYWVEIADSCGFVSDTINVNFGTIPTVDLGNDTTLCEGETFTINVTTPNATYLWQDNSTDSTLIISEQGTYWVEITNICGSATDIFSVEGEDCEAILEIPNVFTPNNDGMNDSFIPLISNNIISMNTVIYNRWGNKVFETNSLSIEWTGENASDGTYFWTVQYRDVNGISNSQSGYVTLIK